MTPEELTPEALALMRRLLHKPQSVEDSALLQLLMYERIVMGSLNKVHLTSQGKRLLAAYEASRPN